jgi:hypothetical protein
MRSPTLSFDFSFRSTLAFTPFQSFLSRFDSRLRSNSCILTSLRTLFLSLRSFWRSRRLFSIACALFGKNTRGMGYLCDFSALFASQRYHLLLGFAPPLFSYSYELLFPQLPYFHNHPHCRGGVTPARRILGGPNPSLQGVLA